jgi:signal transduction histidine kinase/DNA-binding response OmpR family regulator
MIILVMNQIKERVLVVESDLEVSDLIARQTLVPLGYRVQLVGSAALAIQEAARFVPDVVIANLKLPGLSGKDLLVGLSAQGVDVPIIVIAEKGMENDVIQAFRLGAADFINYPLREAEVVSAVERVLKQTRARREREQLSRQLNQMNQELQRRVRELTTIFSIGKAVISITDQRALFDKIVEGAVYITEADLGWLLLKDERSKTYLLCSQQNLPASLVSRLNQPWDDGLSSLVALSGESLSIHGDPIKRFKVAQLGQSALVVPLKVKNEVMGLLVAVRQKPLAFNANSQALLEAVADYASISLVNARLFKALEERVRSAQVATETAQIGEQIARDLLSQVSQELKNPLPVMKGNVDLLLGKSVGSLTVEQTHTLNILNDQLQKIVQLSEAVIATEKAGQPRSRLNINLSDLVSEAAQHYEAVARQQGISIRIEVPPKPVQVLANPAQVLLMIESLLNHSICWGSPGGQRKISLETTSAAVAHVFLEDKDAAFDEKQLQQLFDKKHAHPAGAARFGGLGISLPLAKEIITAQGGKIWIDDKPGKGIAYHFTLPQVGV